MIGKIQGLEDEIRRASESEQPEAGLEGSEQPDEGTKGTEQSKNLDLEESEGSE